MRVRRDPHLLALLKKAATGGSAIQRLLLKLALTATIGSLFASTPIVAQLVPPAPKAERVEIIKGPSLEGARSDLAIIRWTTNNPAGTECSFRRRILRDGSERPEPGGEISHPAQPGAS